MDSGVPILLCFPLSSFFLISLFSTSTFLPPLFPSHNACHRRLSLELPNAFCIVFELSKLIHTNTTKTLVYFDVSLSVRDLHLQSTQAPHRCTKCNSPSINGQCTNHHIAVRCSTVLMCPLNG